LIFLNYLGLLLLSLSWLWTLHVFHPPGGLWPVFIVLGIALLVFPARSVTLIRDHLRYRGGGRIDPDGHQDMSRRKGEYGRLPRASLMLLIPMILAIFTLPRPFNLGPIVLSIALIGGVVRGEGVGGFRPITGGLIAGAVLTVQSFLFPIVALISAHVHTVPVLGYILYPFIRLFDPTAYVSGGVIFVSSVEEIFGLGVSMEKLALIPMALFFAAVVLFRAAVGDALRTLLRLLLAFLVYGAVRFIAVFFAAVILNNEVIFWNRLAILLSLIPLPLLVAWAVPGAFHGGEREKDGKEAIAVGVPLRGTVVVALAAFLAAGSLLFHDPGSRKGGRVLFDERYSDWEWSTQVYDRDWYGSKSGYNYYCLAEYINHFFDMERGLEPFTPEYLAGFDIVIIKTPTQSFTEDEIDMLSEYVENGGGLYLIGDHTNVFGTSTNLNPIAARFGLRFNYDSTYQLHSLALTNYYSPRFLAHPVMLHVPHFFFATSCSMDSPVFGENVIAGNALRAIHLDYSQVSYFPKKDEKEYDFGYVMQMAGVKAGKGRVLGFTDSTVFSNFFMFIPGKPELFLGSLDWLNRTNRWSFLNLLFIVSSVLLVVYSAAILRRYDRLTVSGSVFFGLTLGVVLSLLVFESLKRNAYPPLKPIREIKTIAFDQDPSRFEMPVKHLVRNKHAGYHTFYVWTQRMGFAPSLNKTLTQSLEASPITVVVNPVRKLSIEEIDSVVEYIRKGGNLLLIVEPRNRMSTAGDFLGIFRMTISHSVSDTTSISNIKGERICDAYGAGFINGGIPLLTLPGGRVVFSYEKLGKGRLFVFSDYKIFSQATTGPTSIVPNLRTREIFELEYQILEILQGTRRPEDIRPYSPAEG